MSAVSRVSGQPMNAAIILAAGASTRLGQPKQAILIEGQSLLRRAAQAALGAPVWPVVVVIGTGAQSLRSLLASLPVIVAENHAWQEGMASSIRCGLAAARSFSPRLHGVIIAPCDQPALAVRHFEGLLPQPPRPHPGVSATRYADKLGAPVWFSAAWFDRLARLEGDQGARQLLRNLPADEITVQDCPELALDIDTPDDLAHVRRLGASSRLPLA